MAADVEDTDSFDSVETSLFLSNAPMRMPDAKELGGMIASYARLLAASQKVLTQIDGEFVDVLFVPDLLRYEATGSGAFDWVIKFCWGDQKKAETWAKSLITANPRLAAIAKRKRGIGAIVLALIVFAPYATKTLTWLKETSEKTAEQPHLAGIQQQTINIGASEYGIKPEEFRRILIETLRNEPSLLRDVSRVVKPARKDPNARIALNNDPELTLKPEAIAELPPTFNDEELPRDIVKPDVQIFLRKTDLDNKNGWAAIIPSLSPNRVTLNVDGPDTDQLSGVVWVRGQVVVEELKDEDGDWIPRRYRLTAIHSTDRQPALFRPNSE